MPVAIPFIALDILVTALFAIACALLIASILRSVAQLVEGIPGVGGYLASAINGMAQGISYVLGKAEHGIDAAIGASWHLLARLADGVWHQIEAQALGYLQVAELLAKLVYAHSGLRALVHRAESVLRGVEHGVKTLEREYHGIEAKVKRIERDITKGIGHDLRIGLKDLRKEVRGIDQQVSTAIPKAIDYAEAKTASLGRFIGAVPGVSFTDWVKGITLAGLAALGLAGLNCKNNPLKGKDCESNVWQDFAGLLAAAAIFGAAVDFRDIVEASVAIESEVAEAVAALATLPDSAIDEAAQIIASAARAVAA